MFFEGLCPTPAIMSTPRSLMFVAGAFSRSVTQLTAPTACKDCHRAADHSHTDASGCSPLNHSTPTLTTSVTTINTPMDKSTVAANLERILSSLAAYASVVCPNLSSHAERLTERPLCIDIARLLLLGEGLAQLLFLLLWEVGREDLEVVLLSVRRSPYQVPSPRWSGQTAPMSLASLSLEPA